MARRLTTVAAALITLAVLAGCRVDVTVDVDVADDGSGTVTVTAVADAGLVDEVPELADDLRFDDLATAGWTVTGPDQTPDGALQVVLEHPFSDPAEATDLLAQLNGPAGPLVGAELARASEFAETTWTFDGTLRVTGGVDAFADADVLAAVGATPYVDDLEGIALADALGIRLDLTLPDAVDDTTGVRAEDGRTVSWSVPLDGSEVALTTIATRTDTGAKVARTVAQVAQFLLVAWIVLAATFVAYVVVARRRRTPAPPRA